MQKEFLIKGTPLFQLEDNFLSISASDSADALFCCVVFSLPTDEHGTMTIARYFEFGSFSGFYTNFGHNKIKEILQLDCLIPYNVYTATDMEMYSARKKKLFLNTKKGRILMNGIQTLFGHTSTYLPWTKKKLFIYSY